MANVPCSQPECDRPQTYPTLGLCRRCYERARREGDPRISKRPKPDQPAHCPVCGKRMRKNRRCRECYDRERAEATRNKPPKPPNGPCGIEGCEAPWVSLGLCHKHYTRLKRHGDSMIVLRVKSTTAPTCRECSRRVKVHGSLCRNCWRESVRNEAPCMVEGCGEPHATQGYCSKHSKRVARYGDPHAVRLRSVELAAQLPEPDGDCINWPYITKTGYGRAVIRGKAYMAHRYVYEQQVGPISAGMELDHLCLNRACVNVNHLEPVTGAENKRRRWIRWWARQESV